MRRDTMVSRRTTQTLLLTAVVSFILVCRVRRSTGVSGEVDGIGLYGFVAHLVCIGSLFGLFVQWAQTRGYKTPFDKLGYQLLSGRNSERLPERNGPPGTTWNGSRWVTEDSGMFAGTSSIGHFSNGNYDYSPSQFSTHNYQGHETVEEDRQRVDREREEQEHWQRVEREDELREEEQRRRREKYEEEKKAKRESKSKQKEDKKDAKLKSKEAKWRVFDEKWEALEKQSEPSVKLTYDDIPWPPKMTELLAKASGNAEANSRERKLAYHKLVRHWHPDKFAAKWKDRLHEKDREKIINRVNAVARALNASFAEGSG